MSALTPHSTPSAPAANELAARRLFETMRDGDLAALGGLLAPDVVLSSPITDRFRFRGRDRVIELYEVVHAPLREFEHVRLVGRDVAWAQVTRARVGRHTIWISQLIEFDDAGLIRELTVFVRPLPGLVAFAAAIVPGAARRRSRLSALLLGTMVRPLVPMVGQGDRVAVAVLRDAWS